MACLRFGYSWILFPFIRLNLAIYLSTYIHREICVYMYACMYVCMYTRTGICWAAEHTFHTCGSYFNLRLGVQRGVPAGWRERVRVDVWKEFVNTYDFRVSCLTSTTW